MSWLRTCWLDGGLLTLLLASGLSSAAGRAQSIPPELPQLRPPAGSAREGADQRQERIYRGTYYQRGAASPAPQLFWYERWHQQEAALVRSTHVHHALGGSVVLRQSALHDANYQLLQFQSEQRQTGVRASARVLDPGRVRLERSSGARLETVVLEHRNPLVVGPTLYGMMLQHWAELASGQRVLVDYLSIERLDTYAFEIRRVTSDADTISFELAAHGWLLSLLVSPLRVVFDTKSRQVLRYEGPSPVLLEQGQELESFDARIEYSERSVVFR